MSTRASLPRSRMKIQKSTASIVCLSVAAAFCFSPAAWAQSPSQPANPQDTAALAPVSQSCQQNTQPTSQGQQQTSAPKPQPDSTAASPSQAPLPVTTYPDAAGNPQTQPPASLNANSGQSQAQTEPQGAATAEKVPTAGGAAAKPAGAAMAPAKQRQARSLLLKMGAVVAGAVAVGTVYALSKGTPSTPPGTSTPGAVQKR